MIAQKVLEKIRKNFSAGNFLRHFYKVGVAEIQRSQNFWPIIVTFYLFLGNMKINM